MADEDLGGLTRREFLIRGSRGGTSAAVVSGAMFSKLVRSLVRYISDFFKPSEAYAQGNNEGNASPSINTMDYRREFRKLGWDVYDVGTDNITKTTPKEKLQYRITGEQFKKSYEANSKGIRNYFSTEEQKAIQALIDGSTVNDKLGFVFVTPENRISITIFSQDKKIGEDGLYVIRKGIGPLEAEGIRKISPDYRKH